MSCAPCKYPMHEQYKGYPGHWYCFNGGYCGKICDTPIADYKDVAAHGRTLAACKTPKWCPGAVAAEDV